MRRSMLIVASLAVVAGGCSCKDDYVVEVVAERGADHVEIRVDLEPAPMEDASGTTSAPDSVAFTTDLARRWFPGTTAVAQTAQGTNAATIVVPQTDAETTIDSTTLGAAMADHGYVDLTSVALFFCVPASRGFASGDHVEITRARSCAVWKQPVEYDQTEAIPPGTLTVRRARRLPPGLGAMAVIGVSIVASLLAIRWGRRRIPDTRGVLAIVGGGALATATIAGIGVVRFVESLGGACGVEPADTSGELGLAILALGAFGVLVWFAWTAVNEIFAAARRATRRRRADFGSPLATRSSRRLDQAVSNNASWCRAVCATHGVGVGFGDDFQFTTIAAPQLYPDAITLRPGVDAKRIAEAIADRAGASVKDSYADLDLSEFGFSVLFEAQWFEFVPKTIDATQVTRHEYDEWVAGWRAENALACPLLPTLLDATDRERDRDAPGVDGATGSGVATALVIASGGAGGAAGHLASGVIGITNVWGSDCSGAFTEIWPDTSCVAYDSVIPAGATPLGPLRIWVRTPPDRDVDPSPIGEA